MMIARARNYSTADIPSAVSPFVARGRAGVTQGRDYSLHAMSVYRGVTFFLVVDDLETPLFLPAWFFESVSAALPADWICSVDLGEGVDLVLGPAFVARDLRAYSAMIDQERSSVEEFWARARQLPGEPERSERS